MKQHPEQHPAGLLKLHGPPDAVQQIFCVSKLTVLQVDPGQQSAVLLQVWDGVLQMHEPLAHPPKQTLPQLPQLLGSVFVFVHAPAQQVWPEGQPQTEPQASEFGQHPLSIQVCPVSQQVPPQQLFEQQSVFVLHAVPVSSQHWPFWQMWPEGQPTHVPVEGSQCRH